MIGFVVYLVQVTFPVSCITGEVGLGLGAWIWSKECRHAIPALRFRLEGDGHLALVDGGGISGERRRGVLLLLLKEWDDGFALKA